MNKKIWYVLEAIVLLESGATDCELMVTYKIPIDYIVKAKALREKLLAEI